MYCSPRFETGGDYARPHVLFGDGVFHRAVYELRVDPKERTRERQRGGHQWILPSHSASVHAVWICSNVPPKRGEERCYEWTATLEACLPNRARPAVTAHATPGSQGCPPKAYAAHPGSVTIRFGHLP